MILAKTWYKTYNSSFLAIFKALQPGSIIKKIAKIRFSSLQIIIT